MASNILIYIITSALSIAFISLYMIVASGRKRKLHQSVF